jgi:hypothetical protein
MATTKLTGTLIRTGSIPTIALGGGVVTSSAQIVNLIPTGTVSSSAQIDYNSIQNKLSGVVSSSTQVQPLLPAGTVSSSAQVPPLLPTGTVSSSTQFKTLTDPFTGSFTGSFAGTHTGTFPYASLTGTPTLVSASSQVQLNALTGTTFSNNSFYFPIDLRVEGNLTAQQIYTEYVSSSVIYESGSSKFGDTTDDVMSVTGSIKVLGGSISGSMVGMFSASAQVDYNSITNKLSGVVSSSTQVAPLLPNGTVSSSAQYPGWVTASSQIDYNSITNKLSGVYSSSAQTVASLSGQAVTFSGSQFSGIVSGSGLQYRLVVPVGTNYYAT